MTTLINYISTLGQSPAVDFETAVLNGLAPDGGLYVPSEIPQVSVTQLEAWKTYSYQDLAFEILSLYIPRESIPQDDLKGLINDSFRTFFDSSVIPHVSLTSHPTLVVQELFHGPTLSFKDVAMGFVVNLFHYFLKRKGQKKTIVVATSGDTGPAAAFASKGKSTLDTWLFYPVGMITDEQARQMTTIPDANIHTVAISDCPNGSDDLDDLIKELYNKEELKTACLSSVNSINWGRVMMQTVHYFYGYLQNCRQVGDLVHFSVPSGAFGNMSAGSLARKMGLPIGKLIVANNRNDVLKRVMDTGNFERKDVVPNLSSAIDISVPANFWRHLYFVTGQPDHHWWDRYHQEGRVQFDDHTHALIQEGFLTCSVNDETTLETIQTIFTSEGYLLDPHGAVAVSAALKHQSKGDHALTVCLATAHPAKFPEVTRAALNELPAQGTHPSIEEQNSVCERIYTCAFSQMVPLVTRTILNHQT